MRKWISAMSIACLLLASAVMAAEMTWENFPRITVAEVQQLQEQEKVHFLDTRTGHDWNNSKLKIPGAQRVADNQAFAEIIDRLPNDAAIVTYCT